MINLYAFLEYLIKFRTVKDSYYDIIQFLSWPILVTNFN